MLLWDILGMSCQDLLYPSIRYNVDICCTARYITPLVLCIQFLTITHFKVYKVVHPNGILIFENIRSNVMSVITVAYDKIIY